MSVHAITERLTDRQLAERENVAFEKLYTCSRAAQLQHENILRWHKDRIHERIMGLTSEHARQ